MISLAQSIKVMPFLALKAILEHPEPKRAAVGFRKAPALVIGQMELDTTTQQVLNTIESVGRYILIE